MMPPPADVKRPVVTQLVNALAALKARVWRRRVPVIEQLSAVECGAACLAMVLSYHNRKTDVTECRELCRPGRDGLSATAIVSAARQYGLDVRAYRLEPEQLRAVRLPAIVHWGFRHFVVVERISKRGVDVVDPGRGRRRVSHQEFGEEFTGVALTFMPGPAFVERRQSARVSVWRHVSVILRAPGARVALGEIFAASLLLQCLGLAFPLATQVLIDRVIPLHDASILTALAVGVALLLTGSVAVTLLRSVLLVRLRSHLDATFTRRFVEHLLSLPFAFFQTRSAGDLLMRLNSNALVREVVTNQTLSVLLDGSLVVGFLVLLVATAPSVGAVAAVFALLQIGVGLITRRTLRELSQRDLATKSEEQGYLVEIVEGVDTVKASGAEARVLARWGRLYDARRAVAIQRGMYSAGMDSVLSAIKGTAPFVLLGLGVQQVLAGDMSLGSMLGANALALSFLSPLGSLVGTAEQLQLLRANLARVADVLDESPEPVGEIAAGPVFDAAVRGVIELRNVAFAYSPGSAPVLRDVSLVVRPNQKVALVGATGSGKSTLARLLLGLYTPTAGSISFGGVPLDRLDRRALRGASGVVMQEPVLFAGSIRDNIALNHPDATLADIIAAATAARIHDEVAAMPMGYETTVAERGGGLSGGQQQRLCLARALLSHPPMVLLDEATSHLDAETEAQVSAALDALRCTRFVVAHRLSTVCTADLILVLHEGRIVERGTHASLMDARGAYWRLVNRQTFVEPGAGATRTLVAPQPPSLLVANGPAVVGAAMTMRDSLAS